MIMQNTISIIDQILEIVKNYELKHSQHKDSCEFLRKKYLGMKEYILKKNEVPNELVEWNKWMAPRIVFDGINHKPLLNRIEKLSKLL